MASSLLFEPEFGFRSDSEFFNIDGFQQFGANTRS